MVEAWGRGFADGLVGVPVVMQWVVDVDFDRGLVIRLLVFCGFKGELFFRFLLQIPGDLG